MSKTDCRQQSNSHQSKCRQNLKMKVTLLKSKKDGKRPLSWPPCRLARKARLVGEPHVGSKYSQQHGTQRFFESSIKRLFKVYKTKKETEIFLLAQKRDTKITRKNFEDKMMFNQRSTGQEVVSEKTETENQCKLV